MARLMWLELLLADLLLGMSSMSKHRVFKATNSELALLIPVVEPGWDVEYTVTASRSMSCPVPDDWSEENTS